MDAAWRPMTMAAVIERRREEPTWFTSEEIKGYITPILQALQLLSDAGLVHRDVKPENILFLNGTPCLGDISLLGEDSHNITRRGTPGYSAPSWFVESGGHPDMFGATTTLYTLLTGNPPDKMGRTAFRWPPQGESSLSAPEKQEWQRIHRIIRRAVDERPAERFQDFITLAQTLETGIELEGQKPGGSKRGLFFAATGLVILLVAGGLFFQYRQGIVPKAGTEPSQTAPGSPPAPNSVSTATSSADSGNIPEMYRADLQRLDEALDAARKALIAPPELVAKPVDAAIASLQKLSEDPSITITSASGRLQEIHQKLEKALKKVPPRPTPDQINAAWDPVDALQEKIHSLPKTTEERVAYDWEIGPLVDKKIGQLDHEITDFRKHRVEQEKKITEALSLFQENLEKRLSPDGGDSDEVNMELWMTLRAFFARASVMIP